MIIREEINKETFGKQLIFEVPVCDELIQDCFMYANLDAPSEAKRMIMEVLGEQFDKIVMERCPESMKDSVKAKLAKIEVKYKDN